MHEGFHPSCQVTISRENDCASIHHIQSLIMTLHPRSLSSIPEMTATVARKSFPKGNPYLKMRDELGVLYLDTDFVTLFRADCGQSALSPGLLALVSVMQFAEGLTDRQAAEAVRSRIELKKKPWR
jgi:transposase